MTWLRRFILHTNAVTWLNPRQMLTKPLFLCPAGQMKELINQHADHLINHVTSQLPPVWFTVHACVVVCKSQVAPDSPEVWSLSVCLMTSAVPVYMAVSHTSTVYLSGYGAIDRNKTRVGCSVLLFITLCWEVSKIWSPCDTYNYGIFSRLMFWSFDY